MIHFPQSWGVLGLATALLSFPFFLWAKRLASVVPLTPPSGGRRAEMRERALGEGYSRLFDRVLRYGGACVRLLLAHPLVRKVRLHSWLAQLARAQERRLLLAGYPVGWNVEEVWALSLVLALFGAAMGAWGGAGSETLVWIFPGACLFGCLPNARFQSRMGDRFTEVARELPAVIDLTALAMGAGLDFPGALRRVTEGQKGVVADELRQVLLSLELGITRHHALLELRERLPISEVKDLVRAVVMAEKKGSSVTDHRCPFAAGPHQ